MVVIKPFSLSFQFEGVADRSVEVEGVALCNCFKVWDVVKGRWHHFISNNQEEKTSWLNVMKAERQHVEDEVAKGESFSSNALSHHGEG